MNSIFDIPPKKVMEATGRPRSTVYRWYAMRRIPIEELDRIEKIFGFKREDVRPDLPWRKE